MTKIVLITGGCGFIASNFITYLMCNSDYIVINVDKMSYCSLPLERSEEHISRYTFYKCDINNIEFITYILERHKVNIVYHFAAQTHVDNSFIDPNAFVQDNIIGTCNLLQACNGYNMTGCLEKFIHVSTDEIRGSDSPSVGDGHEDCYYNPTNPYSASKASAELMAKSYLKSFKLPVIITRSNNVYGVRQYKEKVIPKFISMLKEGKPCPVYGDGSAKRTYLYVEDACRAYQLIMEKGQIGQIYEMGSTDELSTLELLNIIIEEGHFHSAVCEGQPVEHVMYCKDRLYHDVRYQVNMKSLLELGWKPEVSFIEGIRNTISDLGRIV